MIVREHINFERGLDPKAAMGIGDEEERIKKIYWPKFEKVFKKLFKEYRLRPSTYSETTIHRANKLIRIEIEFRGKTRNYEEKELRKGYFYFLGYNLEIKKYYCGYTTDADSEMPIKQEIDSSFELVCDWLLRFIDSNETLK